MFDGFGLKKPKMSALMADKSNSTGCRIVNATALFVGKQKMNLLINPAPKLLGVNLGVGNAVPGTFAFHKADSLYRKLIGEAYLGNSILVNNGIA